MQFVFLQKERQKYIFMRDEVLMTRPGPAPYRHRTLGIADGGGRRGRAPASPSAQCTSLTLCSVRHAYSVGPNIVH